MKHIIIELIAVNIMEDENSFRKYSPRGSPDIIALTKSEFERVRQRGVDISQGAPLR